MHQTIRGDPSYDFRYIPQLRGFRVSLGFFQGVHRGVGLVKQCFEAVEGAGLL